MERNWNNEEIIKLKEIYNDHDNKELAKIFNTTQNQIKIIKKKLCLYRKRSISKIDKKQYTYDEVKNDFNIRGYDLISTVYCKKSEKLEYICEKHSDKGIQYISYVDLLRGRGCKFCGIEKTVESRKKPDEYYIKLCNELDFTYVGRKRINGVSYIDYICNKHKNIGVQSKFIGSMDKGIGCIYCSGKNRKTTEKFKEEMYEVNKEIRIDGEYVSQNNVINCTCLIHNIKFSSLPGNLLKGENGCPECTHEKRIKKHLSQEDVKNRIKKMNPHIKLISKYNEEDAIARCYCTTHGKYFTKAYCTLYDHESGCDECYRERIIKISGIGENEFIARLKNIHPEVELKSKFITNTEMAKFYCKTHNYTFEKTPLNVIKGLTCCPKGKNSKENIVCDSLEKLGFEVERQKTFQDCKDKNVLPFDFFISKYNCAIEYDGEQHYFPVNFGGRSKESSNKKFLTTKKHDEIKNNYCKKNNIKLIRIPYFEFGNLNEYLIEKLKENDIKVN